MTNVGSFVKKGKKMRPKRNRTNKPSTVTIQGVIALIDPEDSDSPHDAVLITEDDEELYVEIPNKRTRLTQYVNLEVEITGVIFEREDRFVISAKRINVIDVFDEYSDLELGDHEIYGDFGDDFYDVSQDLQDFMRYSRRSGGVGYKEEF